MGKLEPKVLNSVDESQLNSSKYALFYNLEDITEENHQKVHSIKTAKL